MNDSARAIPRLALEHISIREVRNLECVELDAAPRLNVITGNNGQGKTSILEALYLLATSRSFRTGRLGDVIRHDAAHGSVRGRFREEQAGFDGGLVREQSCGLQHGKRVVRIDGEAPESLTHYATRSPVVVFEPRQLSLSTGPAAGRRTLLDRITLFQRPELAGHRARYSQALKARQSLLTQARGPALGAADELDAFETLLASHGAAITVARQAACETLEQQVSDAFGSIGDPSIELEVRYQPGGSEEQDRAREELAARRAADAQARRAGFGPHRDDLELRLDGHPARTVGSQGQHRAITLALKIAELDCIAAARGLQPILLLDDVSSELDPERTEALFAALARTDGQIFLTTTRPNLIVSVAVAAAERRDFRVEAGQLQQDS